MEDYLSDEDCYDEDEDFRGYDDCNSEPLFTSEGEEGGYDYEDIEPCTPRLSTVSKRRPSSDTAIIKSKKFSSIKSPPASADRCTLQLLNGTRNTTPVLKQVATTRPVS